MKMDEQGKRAEDFSGRQQEVFKIYKKFNMANEHKMVPIPVCVIPDSLKTAD
jgi:NAD+ synthase